MTLLFLFLATLCALVTMVLLAFACELALVAACAGLVLALLRAFLPEKKP